MPQGEGAVGSALVEVVLILMQRSAGMRGVEDEEPVQQLSHDHAILRLRRGPGHSPFAFLPQASSGLLHDVAMVTRQEACATDLLGCVLVLQSCFSRRVLANRTTCATPVAR